MRFLIIFIHSLCAISVIHGYNSRVRYVTGHKIRTANDNTMKQTFEDLFLEPRNSQLNYYRKVQVRKLIVEKLQKLGLLVNSQSFKINDSSGHKGVNIIATLPSINYNKDYDRILVIGAHYDTVNRSPGVDDNGSGCVATLEIASILSPLKHRLLTSIYFVFFDEEETGMEGSRNFVRHYLIPELKETSSEFIGSIVIDMIMHYNSSDDSQTLPKDIKQLSPYVNSWMSANRNRGDFLAVLSRKNTGDILLSNELQDSWKSLEKEEYKLLPLIADIPWNSRKWRKWFLSSSYTRSDHSSFWNTNTNLTLPAVMLWDLGVWRGRQAHCYHKSCDDISQLTDENIGFLVKTVNAVTKAVLKLATS